ncbi:hypothetical protein ACFQ48_04390 [Hymenobacter caeli]|uniref:Histidine kinase n=1 Tax=Hymenobacter caeli TaxID=2735894 RepID=A0ABX2FPU5_9BACT|nr:hypothetical protein [Hymenobacter caeli]NRT19197.1 hypothetical protein [Hymenobacter caeli]
MPTLFRWSFGLLLCGSLLAPNPSSWAGPRPRYALDGHERPVALLRTGKATYLVTQRSVFRLEGKQLVRKYRGSAPIQCAAAADTVLWLGTHQGLLGLNTRTFGAHPLALPGPEAAPNITAVFRDLRGALWVGANGYGAFRWANGAFAPELGVASINGGVATTDSSVWVATSVGLNRKRGAEWIRYNEEGVGNREIPDNIVEKLLPDNAGNLWVVMSDAICVFEAGGTRGEAELPTVRFLGRPGNELYGVASVRGEGRLFATGMGLLLLPNEPADRLTSFDAPATDKVAPARLLRPVPAPAGAANPVLLQVDDHQRLWLVSEAEVVVLTTKEFHRLAAGLAKPAGGTAKL